jgi:hypothetical protein
MGAGVGSSGEVENNELSGATSFLAGLVHPMGKKISIISKTRDILNKCLSGFKDLPPF